MKKKTNLIHVHKRTLPIQKNYIILGIQKKSLINRVRLSFKILKHKYWIIKKKMRQFNIQKEEEKHETNKVLQKHILV